MHPAARTVVIAAALAAATYMAARLSSVFIVADTNVVPIWLPTGIGVGVLVLAGLRPWPGILLGGLAYELTVSHPAVAFAVAAANTTGAVVAAALLRRMPPGRIFAHPRSVVGFLLVAATYVIPATVGTSAWYAGGLLTADGLAVGWLTWWVSDVASLVFIVPLVVGVEALLRSAARPVRAAEGYLLLMLTLGGVLGAAFADGTSVESAFEAIIVCAVAWAAFRFGPAAVGAVCLLAIGIHFTLGVGGPLGHILSTQFHLGALASAGYIAAATLVAREEAEKAAAAERVASALIVAGDRAHFLNSVAHELNTPLTPVTLQVYMLRNGSLGPLTERQGHALLVVERSMDRLTHLVKDILDIARIDSGVLTVSARPVDVARSVREVLDIYEPLAAKNGVTLRLDVRADALVETDPRRLAQVLTNLLSNAVKYSPPGEEVIVTVEHVGRDVRVTVRDHGPGLDPAQMARLFHEFEQVLPQGVQKEGTGLGLVVSKRIMGALGGDIGVSSDGPGKGTSFHVTLPRSVEPPGVAGPPARTGSPEAVT